jgi:hypothetical protein
LGKLQQCQLTAIHICDIYCASPTKKHEKEVYSTSLNEKSFSIFEELCKDLVVVDKHISQALNPPILDRLWLWLLQVAVMRSEPDL